MNRTRRVPRDDRPSAGPGQSPRLLLVALLLAFASPARAALPVGATAPDFRLQAALGGRTSSFSLHDALGRGPVVLYFFPAAFTAGCTIEAHDFADATDAFRRMGATVIGVTAGNVERVAQFSAVECRNKFAVAADPGATVAARYDVVIHPAGLTLSSRTSFVIAPDGRILMSYTNDDPDSHIRRAMDAVTAYRERPSGSPASRTPS